MEATQWKKAGLNRWSHLNPGNRRADPNQVRSAVYLKKGGRNSPNVTLWIGENIVDSLHWVAGDKVDIFYCGNELLITRNPSGTYRLGKPGGSSHGLKLCYSAKGDMHLSDVKESIRAHTVGSQIVDNSLNITL